MSTSKSPNRLQSVGTTAGSGDKIGFQHPIVRRLLKGADRAFDKISSLHERERFKQVTTSLALPMSLLISLDKWRNHRERGKFLESFVEGIEFLSGLDLPSDEHIDLIKFDSASLFQRAVGDVDPLTGHQPLPFPASLEKLGRRRVFGGELHRLISRALARARQNNRDARSFFASYLLCKRGWPQLCDKKLLETIADHQKYLTMMLDAPRDELLSEIRTTCKKVFRNASLSKLSPSLNASSESTRKEGGADGFVAREVTHVTLANLVPQHPSALDFHQAKMNWQEYTFEKCDELMRTIDCGEFFCRAQVIPEPGKFRMITAGPAVQYTWLQPLQGLLLSQWAKTPYSTMKEGWEDEVESWVIPDDWVWNSGDYKAATDQLNGHCSIAALQAIVEILALPADFVARSGFGGVEVRYSKKDRGDLPESIVQTNGQLMGHPLSFPILCVINLAALICTLKEAVRAGDLDRSAVQFILDRTKVNGDDILFPCPKRICQRWEKNTGECGLKLSVGKSYACHEFAMVNNVMFDMVNHRRIGYLNQKLVLNHCLKTGESEMTPFEIGHAFNKMFGLVPRAVEFLPDAVSRRRDTPVYGYQPNLFVPCELGGFGVDSRFCVSEINFTWEQRVVASAFYTGSLNSILFRNGKVETTICSEILKRMPKPLISSSTDAMGWIMSGKAFPWEEDYENYASFVGSLSVPTSVKERDQRRLDLSKMRHIKPLSVSKMRESIVSPPFFLVPRLPKVLPGPTFSYTRTAVKREPVRIRKPLGRIAEEEIGCVGTLLRFRGEQFFISDDGVCRQVA